LYAQTAGFYSNYAYELETGGQRINQAGRVTEVFVLRNGQWVNPGWHMDSGSSVRTGSGSGSDRVNSQRISHAVSALRATATTHLIRVPQALRASTWFA